MGSAVGNQTKLCEACNNAKPLSEFYQKQAKGRAIRWDLLCKNCFKQKRKIKRQEKKQLDKSELTATPKESNRKSQPPKSGYYKTYETPSGRVNVTKEDFDRLVNYFSTLSQWDQEFNNPSSHSRTKSSAP